MDAENTPLLVSYRDWCREANKVAEEDLQLFGFTLAPEGIMRRAQDYIVRIEDDGNVLLWAGWQQAMRGNRERYTLLYCLDSHCRTLTLHNTSKLFGLTRYQCLKCARRREQALAEIAQLSQELGLYD